MSSFSTPPADLIARCVKGDDAAQAQFYGEYAVIVRRAAVRALHVYDAAGVGAADADDLASEVFAKLLANECALLDRVRNSRSIYAWLVAITRNLVIDHLRRAAARERSTTALVREAQATYMPSPSTAAVSNERAAAVRSAVEGLEPADRLALELYFVQGLTYAQMAAILHANANTVSARVRRAKDKLRRILRERGMDGT